MADVIERPQVSDPSVNDDDLIAHIGRANDVTAAYVTGAEITALCGHRFVPSRNPDGRPICEACKAALGQVINSGSN